MHPSRFGMPAETELFLTPSLIRKHRDTAPRNLYMAEAGNVRAAVKRFRRRFASRTKINRETWKRVSSLTVIKRFSEGFLLVFSSRRRVERD